MLNYEFYLFITFHLIKKYYMYYCFNGNILICYTPVISFESIFCILTFHSHLCENTIFFFFFLMNSENTI
jgi:hypothetical protein